VAGLLDDYNTVLSQYVGSPDTLEDSPPGGQEFADQTLGIRDANRKGRPK